MKHRAKIILLIGVIAMFNLYGCSGNLKYTKYSSKDAELGIEMDYVSGWLYNESRGAGNTYAQVVFYEPIKETKKFNAGIIFTAYDSSKLKFASPGAETFADDLLKRRQKFQDMKLLSKSYSKLFGTGVIQLELTYKALDKLYATDAKLVPVKERIAIFKQGSKIYTLRYINTDTEYARFSKAFSHIIKSLKFKSSK